MPCLYVLAGTNGAGKSSIGGAAFRERGADYFNPDEVAQRIRRAHPRLTPEQVNSASWFQGKRLLERAIEARLDFAFETTLGGDTIASLLEGALSDGIDVRIWYVALGSPELHIARVRARVAKGGHDIPETKVRERYDRSRLNLIRLLPKLTELRVYDNSVEADPAAGHAPRLMLILHTVKGRRVAGCDLRKVPQWAKAIVAVALRLNV